MKWVDAKALERWAEQLGAPETLPILVGRLILASAANIAAFRFPGGNSGKIHGWDGRLFADPRTPYTSYVPQGSSVWELSVEKTTRAKAERDYKKRSENPGDEVDPKTTTLVLVTARTWAKPETWIAEKKKLKQWKDIRVIDAVDLENWLMLCPAVAASFARENGFAPSADALSVDEFWELYSRKFDPSLTEAVVLAGRSAQQQEMERAMASGRGIQRCKGDSLEEVLAFTCAVIRSAEESSKEYLNARTLILQTEHGARQLKDHDNLLFAVRGEAVGAAGYLADRHRVIVPVGRDDIRPSGAISLVRPTVWEMSEALKTMGFGSEEASRLAHESGKSVTVLGRRRPSATATRSEWSNNPLLLPALLAGAWDQASEADRAIIAGLASRPRYEEVEGSLRQFLSSADAPLELVGSVWSVRAPVDLFIQISHLLHDDHWTALEQAAHIVLGEQDPGLDLAQEERMYAALQNKVLKHTSWVRDGIATTLLVLAAMGEQNDVRVRGRSPQVFVNSLVAGIPGLKSNYRVIASLSRQLPMLMEAAPDPFLDALEHLLEGDGTKLKPIFRDSKTNHSLWSDSPHTGLLWALEVIGHDPEYLQRAATILARLVAIDPGGSLSNRPLGSFRSLFLTWLPGTNAPHEMRLAVLDQILTSQSGVAWTLLLSLLPNRQSSQFETPRPRFREAGASERENLTYPILYKTITWIVEKAIQLAGAHSDRWVALLKQSNNLPERDRQQITDSFTKAQLSESDHVSLWTEVSKLIRRHRAYPGADWTLSEDQLNTLEQVVAPWAPNGVGVQDTYLFTEALPDIPNMEESHGWERIEEMRHNAVKRVLESEGIPGVLELASKVEAPRYVGASLGLIASHDIDVLNAIVSSQKLPHHLYGFASAASSAALTHFGEPWRVLLTEARAENKITDDLVVELTQWWPHSVDTWHWIEAFGPAVEQRYWQEKHAWGIQASRDELVYAVEQYLRFGRPECVVEEMSHHAAEIPSNLLLQGLSAYGARISEKPELLQHQSVSYRIQQTFTVLQKRADFALAELAVLEYQFLPMLRETWRETDPNSALDRYIAENPQQFVQVITDVFRPASERGKPKPDSPAEQIARARVGMTLLESFSRVPGQENHQVDSKVLEDWVASVRQLAKEADRLEIAEQYIGKLLTHSVSDQEDGLWPHRAVREGLERWQSTQIEIGIRVGKANARGVTSRGPLDGGALERSLAGDLRADAAKLNPWPRTKAIYVALASGYEQEAEIEDMEVEKLRLRE